MKIARCNKTLMKVLQVANRVFQSAQLYYSKGFTALVYIIYTRL